VSVAVIITSAAITALATLWAGLFALAEEAVTNSGSALMAGLRADPGRIDLNRALHASRLALLVIAGAAASEALGWWLRPGALAGATLALAILLPLTVGEALPRALAGVAPELAQGALGPARRLLAPFAPLLWVLMRLDRWARAVRASTSAEEPPVGAAQREMLLGLFSLADTTVSEIMTPRLDTAAVSVDDSLSDVLDALRESEHARLPVYEGTLDTVVGVLYAKDLLPLLAVRDAAPHPWQDLVRPAQFVPEAKPLDGQLADFQKGPSHIAIVVDEYGGTAGLVTREDVLEEIVGEIHDEYDVVGQPPILDESGERFWVDGTVSLDDLSEALGARIERDDVATVGGLVLSVLGRVPDAGEEFVLEGFRVVVERVVRRRVTRVYFERLGAATPAEASEEE